MADRTTFIRWFDNIGLDDVPLIGGKNASLGDLYREPAPRATSSRRKPNGQAWRTALLVCGIVSSLLYAGMIWAIRYEGYSPISQVPSELTAIGAPTQALWARLGWIYTVLIAAFGIGVWKSAGGNRGVRLVGGLIVAHASLGLLWPFAPMHQREVLAAGGGTPSDTLHQVLGAVTVFLMFLAIGFGATAFGKRFRLYSIVTIVVLLAFGGLTFLEAPRLQMNLPTPWIGLWERIKHQRLPDMARRARGHPLASRAGGRRDAMTPLSVAVIGAGLALCGLGLLVRYRRDMNAARARLAAVERHVVSTKWGAVEYAERGHGDPVLVAHGIFQNCVGGLLDARSLYRSPGDCSVSIRLSRLEYAGERDAGRPGRRIRRTARHAGPREGRRHRFLRRHDLGAAIRPASSQQSEASGNPGGQFPRQSHCGRAAAISEVPEAIRDVGVVDLRSVNDDPDGCRGSERIRDDERERPLRQRVHRQSVPHESRGLQLRPVRIQRRRHQLQPRGHQRAHPDRPHQR